MNIFYTNTNAVLAAQDLPDKLVVKMPLETAQMLCTAHRALDGDAYADEVGLYKTAYLNHPCTIWARETSANYGWLYEHFCALCEEYEYRYCREHLSYTKLANALSRVPQNMKIDTLTTVAQAMPDQYKDPNPTVAYRNYLINEKHYAEWNHNRAKPTWWVKQVEECA